MACKRKPLVVFSITLVMIAAGLLGHSVLIPNPGNFEHNHAALISGPTVSTPPIPQAQPKSSEENKTPALPAVNLTRQGKQPTRSIKQNIIVSGRIESEFGEIISGETIALHSPQKKVYYTTVSSLYGEYVFTDVQPGPDYVITVSPQGMYKRFAKSWLSLQDYQVRYDIVLETVPLGMLTGTVLDSYERPVPAITLTLRTLEKDFWSVEVVTDANGAFAVPRFPKGRFEVASSRHSFKATGLAFDPDYGESVILSVDSGPYRLGGRIFDESGQAFDGANVIVVWKDQDNSIRKQSTRQVTADMDGRFRFTGLGPGVHELIVSAWNGTAFKKTRKQIINLGVESGELDILIETL